MSQVQQDRLASSGGRSGPLWWSILLAGLVGTALTTVQIIEKIAILKDPTTDLACDVNSVLSCSNVLMAWQSSVLGPPNALIGAIMFTILWSTAIGHLLGTSVGRRHLVVLWGLALFFLCFATWFMEQTAFSIAALCLWCIGITTMVIVICACLTRIAVRDDAYGGGAFGRSMATLTRSGLDIIIWIAWWLVIAAMLVIGLAL
jgi:uncharacterized membrane protein